MQDNAVFTFLGTFSYDDCESIKRIHLALNMARSQGGSVRLFGGCNVL